MGAPGNSVDEGCRVYRLIFMGLMALGLNSPDSKKVSSLMNLMGNRASEEIYQ